MPEVRKAAPPFVQISDHYRDLIHDGQMQPGAKLPAISAIAAEWHVAAATAAKAITRLQIEGAVWSGPQGTFVSGDDRITRAPGERIRAVRPAHLAPGSGTAVDVIAAGIVTPPDYVAGLFGLDPGSQVVRREEVTSRHGRPRILSVDWIPAGNVMEIAELLQHAPIEGGPERLIATVAGRKITHAQDYLESRSADSKDPGHREAEALAIEHGSPVLAGTHLWSDDDGVILYGEWVMRPSVVVSYEYEVTD